MILRGHVQMLLRVFSGQTPQAAKTFQQSFFPTCYGFGFGEAQIIVRHGDGYVAGSDHRKDGCAAGFRRGRAAFSVWPRGTPDRAASAGLRPLVVGSGRAPAGLAPQADRAQSGMAGLGRWYGAHS